MSASGISGEYGRENWEKLDFYLLFVAISAYKADNSLMRNQMKTSIAVFICAAIFSSSLTSIASAEETFTPPPPPVFVPPVTTYPDGTPLPGFNSSGQPIPVVPPMGFYPTPPPITNPDGTPYSGGYIPPSYGPIVPTVIGFDPSGNAIFGPPATNPDGSIIYGPQNGYIPPSYGGVVPTFSGFDSNGNAIFGAPATNPDGTPVVRGPMTPIIGYNTDGTPIFSGPTDRYVGGAPVPPMTGYVSPMPPVIGTNDDGTPQYDPNWVPPVVPGGFYAGANGPSFGIPELDSNGNVLYIPTFDALGNQVNVPPPPSYVPQRDSQGNLLPFVPPQYDLQGNPIPTGGTQSAPTFGAPIGFNLDGTVRFGAIPVAVQAQSSLSTWGVTGTNPDGSPRYGIVAGDNPNPVVPMGVDSNGLPIFGVPPTLQQSAKNTFLGAPTPGFDSYGNSTAIPMTSAAAAKIGSWAVVDARGNVIDAIACTAAVCGQKGALKGKIADELLPNANCPPAGCALVMQIPGSATTAASLTGFLTDDDSKVTFRNGVFTVKTKEVVATADGAERTVTRVRTIKDGIMTDSTGERIDLSTGAQLPSRITDPVLKKIVDTEIRKAPIVPVVQDDGILLATPVLFSAIDTNLKVVAVKGGRSRTLPIGVNETGKIFLKTTVDLEGYEIQIKRGTKTLKKLKVA